MSAPKILWLQPKHMSSMNRRNAVVLLHNPTCEKCNKFAPHYQNTNAEVYQDLSDRDINLFRINVHKHKDGLQSFLSRYRIKSFPSIILFRKGHSEPSIIRDVRNRDQLIRAIKKEYNPVGKVFSDALVNRLKESHRVRYAEDVSDDSVLQDTGVMVALSHRDPSKGLTSLTQLYDQPSMVLFHRPTCPHCTNFMPVYDRVAVGAPKSVRVLTIDMDQSGQSVVTFMQEHNNGKRAEGGRITLEGVPTVYLVVPDGVNGSGGRVKKVSMRDMTEASLLNMIRKEFRDRVVDSRVAQRLTHRDSADGGEMLGKQYNYTLEEVARTDCLVLFYASWCGACKSTLPLVRALAERLSNQNKHRVDVFTVDHDKHRRECDRFMNNYNEISLLGPNAQSASLLEVSAYPTVYIFRGNNPNGAIRVRHDPTHANKEHHYLSLPLMGAFLRQNFPNLPETVAHAERRQVVPGLVLTLGGGEADDDEQVAGDTVSVRDTNSDFVSRVSLFSNVESSAQPSLIGGGADGEAFANYVQNGSFQFDTEANRKSLYALAKACVTTPDLLKIFTYKNTAKKMSGAFTNDSNDTVEVGTDKPINYIDPTQQENPCMYSFVTLCMFLRASKLGDRNNATGTNDEIISKYLSVAAATGGEARNFFDASFNSSSDKGGMTTAWNKILTDGENARRDTDTWGNTALEASQKTLIYQTKFNVVKINDAIKALSGNATYDKAKDLLIALFPTDTSGETKYEDTIKNEDEACPISQQIALCALVAAQIVARRRYKDSITYIAEAHEGGASDSKKAQDIIEEVRTNADDLKDDSKFTGGSPTAGDADKIKAFGFLLRDFHMTTHALFYECRFRGMTAHIDLLTNFFKKCNN